MAKRIGFKWGNWGWGSERSSVSKWEKSLFGGYHRLITDYPRVVVDMDLDFDFAPIEDLVYWEKDKLCKIFLSKTKSMGHVQALLRNAKTETQSSFIHGKIIKTTIDRNDKLMVLDVIIANDKEYAPLFKHYKEFLLNTDISFKRPEQKSGDGSSDEKNDKNDKQDKNKDNQNSGSSKSTDGKQQNQNHKKDQKEDKGDQDKQENSEKNKDENGNRKSDNSKSSDENILMNLIELEKALNDVKEEEYKFESLSTFNKKNKIQIQTAGHETTYTQEEKDIADRLTNMLDISFDPTSDTVKNLRLGKLDITKIAEVPAGNIAIYKQEIENQTTKPFSVVILCDESGSMSMRSGRLHSQYQIVKSLYLSFSDIIPQDKIFVYGHSGEYDPELYIYHDVYNQNFLTTIDNMITRGHRQNYDGPIIEEVYKNVRAATSDRIIFIVLSDGVPEGYNYGNNNDIVNMKQIIEKCKRDEFVTVGVGIQAYHVKNLYQYSAVVDDLSDMPKKVSYILNHVVKTEFQ